MVQRGVAAVVRPFTGQGQTEVPTVVKAGIPYITMSGESTTELTTPGSFALQGGFPAVLGAVALQAKQKGYKKVAFVVANVPAVVEARRRSATWSSRLQVSATRWSPSIPGPLTSRRNCSRPSQVARRHWASSAT